MHNTVKITDGLTYIGASCFKNSLFENVYPVGSMSYNSYLLTDEKTVLFDTADQSVSGQFRENLTAALGGRTLDFIIVTHMEPDHSALLKEIAEAHPGAVIVCSVKAYALMKQFGFYPDESRVMTVKEGETLNTGRHELCFYSAPMVHWPEVTVVFDKTDKILFSADAFGTFGAIRGGIFADETPFASGDFDEARRYYANIVGKYGLQVTSLLKKLSELEAELICPLHGPVWRTDVKRFIEKYSLWASYTPEQSGVLIAVGSIYGHTLSAAERLATLLCENGVTSVALYDASAAHPSYILADAFKYSHIVLACSTYNNGLFTPVETLINELASHNLQNRTAYLIENGSWAPAAGKLMKQALAEMKNITCPCEPLTIRSSADAETKAGLMALAQNIAASVKGAE